MASPPLSLMWQISAQCAPLPHLGTAVPALLGCCLCTSTSSPLQVFQPLPPIHLSASLSSTVAPPCALSSPLLVHIVPSSLLFTSCSTTQPAHFLDQPLQFFPDSQPKDLVSLAWSCAIPTPALLIFPAVLLSSFSEIVFRSFMAQLCQTLFTAFSPSACPSCSLALFWSSSSKCSSPQPVTCR